MRTNKVDFPVEQVDDTGCTGIRARIKEPTTPDPSLTYWETLGSALEATWDWCAAHARYKGHGVPEMGLSEFAQKWEAMYAEQTQKHGCLVVHPTKSERWWKWIYVSIYRMPSGRYEVTAYVA